MTKKRFWLGLLAIGLVLSGCATNKATTKDTNFERKPMGLAGSPKYTILGTVTLEKDWLGVLGYSTQSIGPFPGGDHYFWQAGGVTYVDLLAKARETYPDADAVVDINYDYSGSVYWVFYAKRTNIVSGIAIKYSREEVDYPPAK